MPFLALTCPQCGGPLPRQASWRIVVCAHCGASVTRSAEVVRRAEFRDALARSERDDSRRTYRAGRALYAIVAPLGQGSLSTVYLAERVGALRSRVILKVAREADGAAALAAEASCLAALQALEGPVAAYFSRRLPQPLYQGAALESGGATGQVLVLRHPDGVWGSLASLQAVQPVGLDPRHVVWIWRRGLETLGFIHANGWIHGDLGLDHLLLHPAAHGVHVIGWARARPASGDALARGHERDLLQLAWAMRAALLGAAAAAGLPAISAATPAPLANLLRQATEDDDWRRGRTAESTERELVRAAETCFGTPRFVAFDPLAPGGIAA